VIRKKIPPELQDAPSVVAGLPNYEERLLSLAPAPLIEGESETKFRELLAGVAQSLKPQDVIEDIWVRNIVDVQWEMQRLRQLKTSFLKSRAHAGLQRVLQELGVEDAEDLARRWARGYENAKTKVDQILRRAKLTLDAANAEVLVEHVQTLGHIEFMLANFEDRRDDILEQLERRRASWRPAPLRIGSASTVHAPTHDVEPGQDRG